jgi:hypothetical protein
MVTSALSNFLAFGVMNTSKRIIERPIGLVV